MLGCEHTRVHSEWSHTDGISISAGWDQFPALPVSPLNYHSPTDRYPSFSIAPSLVSLTHVNPVLAPPSRPQNMPARVNGITDRINQYSKRPAALLRQTLLLYTFQCDASVYALSSTLTLRSFSVLCVWPARNGLLNSNSILVFQGVPHFPTLWFRVSKSSETEFKCIPSLVCLSIHLFIQPTCAEDLLYAKCCARLWDIIMEFIV